MISNLTLSQDVFNTPDIRTKMKIMHAVDKSLDRVTISEICEKAGNRVKRFTDTSKASTISPGGSRYSAVSSI